MIVNKIRREAIKLFSRSAIHSAVVSVHEKKFRVPMVNGVGSSYFSNRMDSLSHLVKLITKDGSGSLIDVGANIGLLLLKARSFGGMNSYYGFEPNPICNHYILELIRLNNFDNARIFPLALSNTEELRTFHARRLADKMGSLNEFVRKDSHRTSSYNFDVITRKGDEIIEKLDISSISLLKIDTEGGESSVLEGLLQTLKKYKPFIFCEVWRIPEPTNQHYPEILDLRKRLYHLLQKMDYKIMQIAADFGLLAVSEDQFFEVGPADNDFLFCHSSRVDELQNLFINND